MAGLVGVGWVVATFLFETFVINRKLSWSQVQQTYDVSAGEFWGFVLLWLVLMPIAMHALSVLRRYITTWGATASEQASAIAGVEFLRGPKIASTHALTIGRPAEKIWPWLVQMGEGRGGLYSYAWLERLVGCDIHNASHILPELQNLRAGDAISLHAKAPKLKVTVLEKSDTLALQGWIFHLQPIGKRQTRLLSRVYTEQIPGSGRVYNFMMSSWFFDLVRFVMSRKQLLNIKRLCEQN